MPRQDVPYGGAICRLRERIAEIWDELGKKLHSINGVEGDAAGDVKIVSGDAAVVITSDQVNHEVEIALDSSQLPAAAVSSVNGQTGAVVLDASDINVIGGSDVATDLGNLDADLQQAQSDIAAEALARANADSALQGNINAAVASIPGAAATAVANDPTVAQLAVDVPNKVDKITSGSTKRAYTHTGAVQDDTPVVNGTDANSIGLRDANGRMQGADPANGATDKTLVTANWVSQTGDSGPNNLLHKNGYETVTEIKYFEKGMSGVFPLGTHIGSTLGHYIIATLRPSLEVQATRYFINGMICARSAMSLFNIEFLIGQNTETITLVRTSALSTYGSITDSTAIGIDVVDNQLKIVVNRATTNNVQTRIQLLHVQRANQGYITSTLMPLEEGVEYTPSSLLAEGFVI